MNTKLLLIPIIAATNLAYAAPYEILDEQMPKIGRTPGSDDASLLAVKQGFADHPTMEYWKPVINIQRDITPIRQEGESGVGIGYAFKTTRYGHEFAGDMPAIYNLVGWVDSNARDKSAPGDGHDIVGTAGIARSMYGSNARAWGVYGDSILKNTEGSAIGAEFVVRNGSGQEAPRNKNEPGATFGASIVSKASKKDEGSAYATIGLWFATNKVSSFHTGIDFSHYSVSPRGTAIDLSKLSHNGVIPILLPATSGIYQANPDGSKSQLVGSRATGWDMPHGYESRAAFDVNNVTKEQLAATLNALIRDLEKHGLIGR